MVMSCSPRHDDNDDHEDPLGNAPPDAAADRRAGHPGSCVLPAFTGEGMQRGSPAARGGA